MHRGRDGISYDFCVLRLSCCQQRQHAMLFTEVRSLPNSKIFVQIFEAALTSEINMALEC